MLAVDKVRHVGEGVAAAEDIEELVRRVERVEPVTSYKLQVTSYESNVWNLRTRAGRRVPRAAIAL